MGVGRDKQNKEKKRKCQNVNPCEKQSKPTATENLTKTEQAATQKSKSCGGTGSAKTAAWETKDAACCKSSTRLRTAKKLMRTIPTSGSRTTAPVTATFTTVCQSARLEQNALFIALFRSQDINATTAKPSCMAQRTILKLRLSKERGKTLKIGSATKRNNRLPEKAGGFFGKYNATAYYCTLLKNVSRCERI